MASLFGGSTGNPLGYLNNVLSGGNRNIPGSTPNVLPGQYLVDYDRRMDDLSKLINTNARDFGPGDDAQTIQMVRATPLSVLGEDFFNTPAYRLAFGSDPQVLNPFADPTERFRADPGYEFEQAEGIRQLLRNHASKGLLESGRSLRDVLGYAQNLADQHYQRYQGQTMGLFSDYQNRLQALMGMGPSVSGAQNAFSLGSDLGNLYANQGVFGGSAMLNTGAAQSGNLMNAASIGAQIASANAAAGLSGGDTGAGSLGKAGTSLGGYF